MRKILFYAAGLSAAMTGCLVSLHLWIDAYVTHALSVV